MSHFKNKNTRHNIEIGYNPDMNLGSIMDFLHGSDLPSFFFSFQTANMGLIDLIGLF